MSFTKITAGDVSSQGVQSLPNKLTGTPAQNKAAFDNLVNSVVKEKFNALMEKYGEGAVRVPCIGLMELVEQENWEGAKAYLKEVFALYDLKKVDAVVLGCTHYVFLKEMIREMLPERIAITEGSEGTARQLKRVLARNRLLRENGEGLVELETSGSPEEICKMRRLLNRAIPEE